MSLDFDEQRAIYDEISDGIVFTGTDNKHLVRCFVTREALAAAARHRAASVKELLDDYRSHAPEFTRIAAAKAASGPWARDETVMVIQRDITGEDPPDRITC